MNKYFIIGIIYLLQANMYATELDNDNLIDCELSIQILSTLLPSKNQQIVNYINNKDDLGMTPLMYASYRGKERIVKKFLKSGAQVNDHNDCNRWTALMYAILENHKKIAITLINAGADINAKSIDGATPLLLALESNNTDIITLLKEYGAQEGHACTIL